ncbi:hypothetical protein HK102_007188, partial [Quaeritorhiza haematococci]
MSLTHNAPTKVFLGAAIAYGILFLAHNRERACCNGETLPPVAAFLAAANKTIAAAPRPPSSVPPVPVPLPVVEEVAPKAAGGSGGLMLLLVGVPLAAAAGYVVVRRYGIVGGKKKKGEKKGEKKEKEDGKKADLPEPAPTKKTPAAATQVPTVPLSVPAAAAAVAAVAAAADVEEKPERGSEKYSFEKRGGAAGSAVTRSSAKRIVLKGGLVADVSLSILEARNLRVPSNPSIKVIASRYTTLHTTKYVRGNNVDPKWAPVERVQFRPSPLASTGATPVVVRLIVMDANESTKDVEIGEAVLDLSGIVKSASAKPSGTGKPSNFDVWLPLSGKSGQLHVVGSVEAGVGGLITVRVLEGKALKGVDATGTSDPYVKIVLTEPFEAFKTPAGEGSSENPQWSAAQSFQFRAPPTPVSLQVLTFEDSVAGTVSLDVNDILVEQPKILLNTPMEFDRWFAVGGADGEVRVKGSIKVFREEAAEGPKPQEQTDADFRKLVGEVTLNILEAKNLKPLDANGTSDPFVQVLTTNPTSPNPAHHTQHPIHTTSVIPKTLNPSWSSEKCVFRTPPYSQLIRVVVRDNDE